VDVFTFVVFVSFCEKPLIPSVWIEHFLQTLPDEVERKHRRDDREARHDDEMRSGDEVGLAVGDHRAPGRRGCRHADA
jgi:hypothetical protein